MLIGLLLSGLFLLYVSFSCLTAFNHYKYYCWRCFRGASALRDSTTIVAITTELVETIQCEWDALYPIVSAETVGNHTGHISRIIGLILFARRNIYVRVTLHLYISI